MFYEIARCFPCFKGGLLWGMISVRCHSYSKHANTENTVKPIANMAYEATECSHCLNFTTEDLDQLESIEEMYLKTREIKEEDKEDDYSDLNSSSDDKGDADQDDPQDDAIELMGIYETERAKVQAFYSETCKCKMGVGQMACSATLSLDDVTECRNNCNELSSAELDLVILGIIHSSLNYSKTSISGRVEKIAKAQECASFTTEKEFARKPSYFCTVFNPTGFIASLGTTGRMD